VKPIYMLLALSSFASAKANAQVAEVYVTANFTHISNIQVAGFTSSGITSYFYKSLTPIGIGGGVTYNFVSLPKIKLGLDARGSTRSGLNGADTALGGLKASINPPRVKAKFFVEGAAGYLGTRADTTGTYTAGTGSTSSVGQAANDYAVYQIIGGVDYPLVRFVDFRVEVSGGTSFGNSSIYGNASGSSAKIFSVNTGLVAHF
jgi:hypothetical protein